jgi:hypothetical protein
MKVAALQAPDRDTVRDQAGSTRRPAWGAGSVDVGAGGRVRAAGLRCGWVALADHGKIVVKPTWSTPPPAPARSW